MLSQEERNQNIVSSLPMSLSWGCQWLLGLGPPWVFQKINKLFVFKNNNIVSSMGLH
jgi:hypothetical protein